MSILSGIRNGIDRSTLRERVSDALREIILSGHFTPGQPIREQQVAAMLKVSRGPIREALIQLGSEGLLRFDPYRGHAVIDPDPEHLDELYSFRALLEGFAAERAAVQRTEAELEHLHNLVNEMSKCIAARDRQAILQYDMAFHETIVRAARHGMLFRCWTSVKNQVVLVMNFTAARLYRELKDIDVRHREILTLIEQRDAIGAGEASRHHILDLLPMLRDVITKERGAIKEPTSLEKL